MGAGRYGIMQACLNGHVITDDIHSQSEQVKRFCPKCGGATITQCPECGAEIQGKHYVSGGMSSRRSHAPNNCHSCGAAYPWRQAEIAAAIEVLQMELDAADAAAVPGLLADCIVDTPRTQIAAIKLKLLLPSIGKATYDVAIKVISDIASTTAKRTLGL
jgi:hypothetical protein